MEVVEEFTAEFEIQFVAEFCNAVLDVFRLDFELFFVVEPVFFSGFHGGLEIKIRDAKIEVF